MFLYYCNFFIVCMFYSFQIFCADTFFIDPNPIHEIINPCENYTLVNSVDFHPKENLFCVTYTHGHKVGFYRLDETGKPIEIPNNQLSNLCHPQHAAFSQDGKKIVVANWTDQSLTVYSQDENGLFCSTPIAISHYPSLSTSHKPHGIAISPCGHFLAIAYGATTDYERAIALFRINEDFSFELLDALNGPETLSCIPKGIAFTPDGSSLLVTFADVNSIAIYDLVKDKMQICSIPHQIIQGSETKISRPEDVKITSDCNYCAVSNSDKHNITFYPFDKNLNRISHSIPIYILQNPEANLCFPHGIAFSPDGLFLVITEFGPITPTENGGLIWNNMTKPEQAKVKIYETKFLKPSLL